MKILIAGDFYPSSKRSQELIIKKQFDKIVDDIKPIIKNADYSIVNFECPIVLNSKVKPIFTEIAHLKCNKEALSCIKYAGFKMIACANNHLHDYGDIGVIDTIDSCQSIDIENVGCGKDLQSAKKNKYIEVCGKKICFINFCENEYSIATKKSAGSNPMDLIANYNQIQEGRKIADYVIVIVHGGVEHYQLPTPQMKKQFRFYVDIGADAIINSHQHCFSGYEYYKEKPIVYGLGNLFFDRDDKKNDIWNEGYMVELDINEKTTINIIPYEQGQEQVKISTNIDTEKFVKRISILNNIIADDLLLEKNFFELLKKSTNSIIEIFEPYNDRYTLAMYRLGILPSFLSKKKLIRLLNVIRCESHRERVIGILSNKLGVPY